MVFVFSAMAEFAVVLFIKQKQAWINIKEDCGPEGAKSNEIPAHNRTIVSNQEMTRPGRVQQFKDQEPKTPCVCTKKNTMVNGLPLTTKIDFGGFIIYCFTYLTFNLWYCFYLLD